jgi:hypothetical protein
VLAAVGVFTVRQADADLLASVDAGLRSRAEVIDEKVYGPGLGIVWERSLTRPEERVALVRVSG